MAGEVYDLVPKEWFGGLDLGIGAIGPYILYGLLFTLIAVMIFKHLRNKEIFKYKVRVFRRREGKQPKEIDCKGGFIKGSDGIQKFRIKLNKLKPWLKVDLDKIPDARYMDEQDRIYYYQLDPTTFIQAKRIFNEKPSDTVVLKFIKPYLAYNTGDIIETQVESAIEYIQRGLCEQVGDIRTNFGLDAYYEPIATDTKRVVVMGLSNAREALKIDLFKLQAMTIGALIVIAVTFLVAYYLLNARGTV